MKRRRQNGSAILDYVLPTALVGLVVGLGLSAIVTDGSLVNMLSGTMNAQVEDGALIVSSNVEETAIVAEAAAPAEEPPAVEPLAEEPVVVEPPVVEPPVVPPAAPPVAPPVVAGTLACDAGECTITTGSFTLTGVPEDFSKLIQEAGISGGTEKIAALITQIIEQLEAQPDAATPENALVISELKRLASYTGSEILIDEVAGGAAQNQLGANSYIMEYFLSGEDPNNQINTWFSPTTGETRYYHEIMKDTPALGNTFTNADTDMMAIDLQMNSIDLNEQHYVNLVNACNDTGKDHSVLLDIVGILVTQATAVNTAFSNEIIAGTLDLETAKNNVVSNTDFITAESISALAK